MTRTTMIVSAIAAFYALSVFNGLLSRCQWLLFSSRAHAKSSADLLPRCGWFLLLALCLVNPAGAEQLHTTDSVYATDSVYPINSVYESDSVYATDSVQTAYRRDSCSTDTGATCNSSWDPCGLRNAVCENNKCVCSSGQCAVNGKCITPAHSCSQVAATCYFGSACFDSSRKLDRNASCILGVDSQALIGLTPHCVCTGPEQCAMNGVCTKPAPGQCVDKGGNITWPLLHTLEYTTPWTDGGGQTCSGYASSTNATESSAAGLSRLVLGILDIMVNIYIYTEHDKITRFLGLGTTILSLVKSVSNPCPTERTATSVGDFNMTANEACCACGGGTDSSQDTSVQASLMSIYDAMDGPGWINSYGCDSCAIRETAVILERDSSDIRETAM